MLMFPESLNTLLTTAFTIYLQLIISFQEKFSTTKQKNVITIHRKLLIFDIRYFDNWALKVSLID